MTFYSKKNKKHIFLFAISLDATTIVVASRCRADEFEPQTNVHRFRNYFDILSQNLNDMDLLINMNL